MNTLKKVLLMASSMVMSLACFASCGGSTGTASSDGDPSTHEHSYTQSNHDESNHWYECACGEIDASSVTAHSYGDWLYNETNHWKECECGAKTGDELHHGGGVACESKAVCEDCGQDYGSIGAHDYSVAKSDETNHWYECACGEINEASVAAHSYVEKYDETNHWEECECGNKINVTAHSYVEKYDETNHWEECECGNKINVTAHSYAVKYDETNHWQECECGSVVDKEAHSAKYVHTLVNDFYQASYACCGAETSLTQTISYFDRENKNLMQANGNVKTNNYNYWDGATNIVSVSYADGVATLSFDTSKFTDEQLANANTSWAGWSNDLSMWVAYAIPVESLDLNAVRISFKYKTENANMNIVVYGAKNAENADYSYIIGENYNIKVDEQVALADGWYEYSFILSDSTEGTTAADYIVLSIDNTSEGLDRTTVSTAYVADVALEKLTYHTVTLDAEEKKVISGETFELPTPTKSGYRFLNWVDAEGKVVDEDFAVTEDVTLTSTWIIALSVGNTSVDIGDSDYQIAEFSGIAGTYKVSSVGVLVVEVEGAGTDGQTVISEIVLEEDKTISVAITYGEELDSAGTVTIEYIYDAKIPETATQVTTYALVDSYNIDVATSHTETVPTGYSSVTCFVNSSKWDKGAITSAAMFNQTDLTAYTDVYFALKLTGCALQCGVGGVTTNMPESAMWVYFHLTQNDDATWTVALTYEDGTKVATLENQNGSTIATLLYDSANASTDKGWILVRGKVSGVAACIYSTEVLGVKNADDSNDDETEESNKPNVAGEKVLDAAFVTSSRIVVSTDNTETAPTGYSSVTKFVPTESWNNGYAMNGFDYNRTDVSAYSELSFALKTTNAVIRIWKSSSSYEATPENVWVYFYLTKNDDATWNITMTWQGANGLETRTIENQIGSTIKELIYDAGSGTATDGTSIWIRANNANAYSSGVVLYTTEVCGTKA